MANPTIHPTTANSSAIPPSETMDIGFFPCVPPCTVLVLFWLTLLAKKRRANKGWGRGKRRRGKGEIPEGTGGRKGKRTFFFISPFLPPTHAVTTASQKKRRGEEEEDCSTASQARDLTHKFAKNKPPQIEDFSLDVIIIIFLKNHSIVFFPFSPPFRLHYWRIQCQEKGVEGGEEEEE